MPPCARPIRQASTAAATKPSSRSISPPWPGIKVPASLAPKRRLSADSNKIADLGDDRQRDRDQGRREDAADATELHDQHRRQHRAGKAADRAGPGLVRAQARRELGTANGAADEIGRDIRRPDHGEQEDDGDEAEARHRSAGRSAQARSRRHRECRLPTQMPRATRRDGRTWRACPWPARSAPRRDAGRADCRRHPTLLAASATASATDNDADHQHRTPVVARHQRRPFPHHDDGGDAPERREDPVRRDRRSRSPAAPARAPSRHATPSRCRSRPTGSWTRGIRVGHDHEPVSAISPPNRRSRRRYSAMAPSSVDRSKSGQ